MNIVLQNITEGLVIFASSCYNRLAKITTRMILSVENYCIMCYFGLINSKLNILMLSNRFPQVDSNGEANLWKSVINAVEIL